MRSIYQDNVLNKYDNYTYKWTMYMVHPVNAHRFEANIASNDVVVIAESGVESETEAVLRDFMQRNMQQGVPADEFEKNKEQLHQGASSAARDRLKSRLILSKIAEKEKVKVENDDFSRMIMMEAQQTGQKPEKLVKELQKDRSRIDRMRSEIILGKTMDLLVEKAERATVESSAS